MFRPVIAYLVSDSGYLAHVKPIIDKLAPRWDHLILTNQIMTFDYCRSVLKLNCYYYATDENCWAEIKSRGIKNTVWVHQKIRSNPIEKELVKFQMFHGVSFKSNELHNWHPSRYDYVLVQGAHYWDSYTSKYSDYKDRIFKTSFARAIYYDSIPNQADNQSILYMPTHHDAGTRRTCNGLSYNLRRVCRSFPRNLIVKLHPINHKNAAFRSVLSRVKREFSDVEFIDPEEYRYVNYQHLFYQSKCLISDFSSVLCEYTMMDRPIVILRGDEAGHHVKKGFQHLSPYVFRVQDGKINSTVSMALDQFCPGSYPEIYIKDAPSIFDFIEERLAR